MSQRQFNAYRDGKVHVCARLCETCIFKPGTPIPPSRVQEMVDSSISNDSAIICHSTLNTPFNAVCRGFHELHGDQTASLRAAKAFDVIKFVEPPSKV